MGSPVSGLLAPHHLRLLPLYIVALLRHVRLAICIINREKFIVSVVLQPAFRSSSNVRVDDRVFAMCQFKSLPLDALMQSVYPDLYPLHNLTDEVNINSLAS
jgi:protein transport protein SEC24